MKKQLLRAAATTVLGLSLTTGFAAAATGNISNTGPSSSNKIHSSVTNSATLDNHNMVHATNTNYQTSKTGKAEVTGNTTGGDAMTGNAMNDHSLDASVSVNNSATSSLLGGMGGSGSDASATIHTTGPSSVNTVESTVKNTMTVKNTNDLKVNNSSNQTATSGNAQVSGNTSGGSATTGDASNSNSSSFNLSVTN